MSTVKKLNLVVGGAVLAAALDYLIEGEPIDAAICVIIAALSIYSSWTDTKVAQPEEVEKV